MRKWYWLARFTETRPSPHPYENGAGPYAFEHPDGGSGAGGGSITEEGDGYGEGGLMAVELDEAISKVPKWIDGVG